MTNSAVWSMYGLLKSDFTILVPNVSGLIAGIVCVAVYHANARKIRKRYYFISGAILLFAMNLGYNQMATWLGYLGVSMAVFLMGSPLVTLKTVIETKSTNALPFAFSVTTFFNALSWSLYGIIVAHDPMVYVPNGIGLVLACIQLSLFVMYGLPDESPKDYEDLEQSLAPDSDKELSKEDQHIKHFEVVINTRPIPLVDLQPKAIQSYNSIGNSKV
jgi:solute carrier family 50 (sugar transporter)